MARIVCGLFDETLKADATLQALQGAGIPRSDVDSFNTLPPGQNALTPIGGDSHSDAGARKAGAGAAIGAAIGGAAGALIAFLAARMELLPSGEWTAVSMVFAAALGAYVGSFMGAMAKMRHGTRRNATKEHPVETPAGRMVAVRVENHEMDSLAVEILGRNGARRLWRAEGTWRDGSWLDFDPRGRLVAV
jgi:hypothetical protein